VSQTDIQALQAENAQLKEELQMREQLVQQLSQELFRLVKGKPQFVPQPEVSEHHKAQLNSLREQIEGLEEQVTFYQEQISQRDTEIYSLRHSVTELTDRARMLEQVVQELPNVYRDKFAERMAPVKEKVEALQKENRQLHAELQSVSYRLAVRNRKVGGKLDLPKLSGNGSLDLPSFGNA
jgi:uncharacterized coiled-coil DUF342 family protein